MKDIILKIMQENRGLANKKADRKRDSIIAFELSELLEEFGSWLVNHPSTDNYSYKYSFSYMFAYWYNNIYKK